MDPKLIIAIVILLALAAYSLTRKARPTGFETKYSPEIADDVCARLFSGQDPARLKALFELYSFKFSPKGTFTFQPPPGAVLNIAKKIYAGDEIENVISALNRYGSPKNQPEREYVQLQIIRISNGDAAKVDMLVEQANTDFRDVLYDSNLQRNVKWLLQHVDIDIKSATLTRT